MTVVHMSEKGQIVVPKEIRDQHGYRNGSAFSVLETKAGALIFRPVPAAALKARNTPAASSAFRGANVRIVCGMAFLHRARRL